MIFQHARFQIWNQNQHPFVHNLSDFGYASESAPGVTNVETALNYIFAVLYPQSKAAVANVAALPTLGNSINDMRVVHDDGDGKAAAYRWEQREGEVSASWHKIYDLDWGTDSILQQFYLKTQDIYVHRLGFDDIDSAGALVVGTLAGQRIFGGRTASTNLTLSANSGDGVGAQTGFVQFTDNVRPTTTAAFDFGTTGLRWNKGWFTSSQFGTLVLAAGSITDTSGAISFDNENLTTSGSYTAGTLVLAAGLITDTSGTISFDNENLTTTGNFSSNKVTATGAASAFASGTTIADFTVTNGNIASSSATVSFNALNLITTGILTAGRVNVDDLRLDGNTLNVQTANTALNIAANGSGTIELNSATNVNAALAVVSANASVTGGNLTVSGAGGYIQVDNLKLDGNTLSTTNSNGDLVVAPNGTGNVEVDGTIFPTSSGAEDLGKTASLYRTLYLANTGSINNGTNQILTSEVLSLRNNKFRDAARTLAVQAGDALFWDAVSGTWLASAPDSEIDHGTLSGLADDDHTQYALLAGRSGGQTLNGDTAASGSLVLDSTANATKGFIKVKSSVAPFTTASFSVTWAGTDVGSSSLVFRHVYTAGEHFGLRLENVGALPSPSTQNIGRLVYYTVDGDPYVDTGAAFKRITQNKFQSDTSWNGTDLTKDVTVSANITDARTAQWQFCDNTNDFERIFCSLKPISASVVRITTGSALPAGSYRLIGIE